MTHRKEALQVHFSLHRSKHASARTHAPVHSHSQLLRDLVRCGRNFPVVNFSQCVLPTPCGAPSRNTLGMYVKRRSVAAFRENMQ